MEIWLLYVGNLENRCGEDFVHAFAGRPSVVDLVPYLGLIGPISYQNLIDGYWLDPKKPTDKISYVDDGNYRLVLQYDS